MSNDPSHAEDKAQAAENDADASLEFHHLEGGVADESEGGSLWASFLTRWLDAAAAETASDAAPAEGEAGEMTVVGQAWIDPGGSSSEGAEG